MANITNPEVVKFANEKIRRLNDMHVAHYRTCKEFVQEWQTLGMGAIFGTNADVVIDGATVLSGTADGRPPMTSFDANNAFNRASEKVTDFEANTNTKLNQANAIAVNTNPLF